MSGENKKICYAYIIKPVYPITDKYMMSNIYRVNGDKWIGTAPGNYTFASYEMEKLDPIPDYLIFVGTFYKVDLNTYKYEPMKKN